MIIFASDKFCDCGRELMLYLFYRFDLCIYGGCRGQREIFERVTLRSLAYYLSN